MEVTLGNDGTSACQGQCDLNENIARDDAKATMDGCDGKVEEESGS